MKTCSMLILLLLTACVAASDAPTSRPSNIDPQVWQRMLSIDAKAAQIRELIADFRQQKFTAMLKKPLVSAGRVRVRGSAMLWDTSTPEHSVLQITDREVRIYYPAQKTIEVYKVQQKLGELAASPVPRLAILEQHFTFEPIPVTEMGESDRDHFFAVKMVPSQAGLREHVEQVRVLLDARRGLIIRLEMRDPDGDRTLISFSNVKINTGISDQQLEIHAPSDVKVTHPLAAMEGAPATTEPSGQNEGT